MPRLTEKERRKNEEKRRFFLNLVRDGYSFSQAEAEAGIPSYTRHYWFRKYPEWREECHKAKRVNKNSGKPTRRQRGVIESLEKFLAGGVSLPTACGILGISLTELKRILSKNVDANLRLKRAEYKAISEVEKALFRTVKKEKNSNVILKWLEVRGSEIWKREEGKKREELDPFSRISERELDKILQRGEKIIRIVKDE